MMLKIFVKACRSQTTILRTCIACWVPKAINTFRICNIYCFHTATLFARTRLSVTLYVHGLLHAVVVITRYYFQIPKIFEKMRKHKISLKSVRWGAKFFHADRQTDGPTNTRRHRHDEPNRSFSQFCEPA